MAPGVSSTLDQREILSVALNRPRAVFRCPLLVDKVAPQRGLPLGASAVNRRLRRPAALGRLALHPALPELERRVPEQPAQAHKEQIQLAQGLILKRWRQQIRLSSWVEILSG